MLTDSGQSATQKSDFLNNCRYFHNSLQAEYEFFYNVNRNWSIQNCITKIYADIPCFKMITTNVKIISVTNLTLQ